MNVLLELIYSPSVSTQITPGPEAFDNTGMCSFEWDIVTDTYKTSLIDKDIAK